MKSVETVIAVGALFLAGALTACSDKGASKAAQSVVQAAESVPGQAREAGQSQLATSHGGQNKHGQGDCDLLRPAELEAAFDGRLSFGRMSGRGQRGSGCTVLLGGGVEGQLVMQAGNRAVFEARKDAYASQSSVKLEPIDLGVEAYRVNDYQIIADAGDDRTLSLGLQVFFIGDSAPISASEAVRGVEALTRQAMARLEGADVR